MPNLIKKFCDIREKKRKHSENSTLSIFEELDGKISKSNNISYLFSFTKL